MPSFLVFFIFLSSCSFKSIENKTDLFFKPQVYDYLLSCDSKALSFENSFSNIFIDDQSSVYFYGFNSCLLKLSFKTDISGYIDPDSVMCTGACQIPIYFYSSFLSCEKSLCSYSLSCTDIKNLYLEKIKLSEEFSQIDFLIKKQRDKNYGPLYQSCQIKLKKIAF